MAALLRGQRQVITTKYARCKLANDGTRFGPGQRVATPGIIKAELVSNYRVDMFNGFVEDIRNFKNHLIVERDTNNPNRLNVLYPPDLINQLRIFAVWLSSGFSTIADSTSRSRPKRTFYFAAAALPTIGDCLPALWRSPNGNCACCSDRHCSFDRA